MSATWEMESGRRGGRSKAKQQWKREKWREFDSQDDCILGSDAGHRGGAVVGGEDGKSDQRGGHELLHLVKADKTSDILAMGCLNLDEINPMASQHVTGSFQDIQVGTFCVDLEEMNMINGMHPTETVQPLYRDLLGVART